MSIRITSDATKISYVVVTEIVGSVVLLLGGLLVWPVIGTVGVVVIGWLLSLGAVVFAVRTFRGDDEPVEPPRPWWRMTARPTSGYVFAGLFALQAVSSALRSEQTSDAWITGVSLALTVVLAVMFLQSSIRLSKGRSERRDLALKAV